MTAVKTLWGPAALGAYTAATSALLTHSLADSDNAAAWSFNIPRDGTITDIGFLLTAENGTSPAYNCGIVTLDSSGRPTTTAYGGSAVTSAQWTSTGWKWVTLSTGATANAGDFAAVHIYPGASAPDGSNNISVATGAAVAANGTVLRWATSWTATDGFPPMAIRYDDGSIHGLGLSTNTMHLIVTTESTPDEIGCLFQLPAAMTVYGVRMFAPGPNFGASAAFDIIIYSAADGVLASVSITDKDFVDDNNVIDAYFDGVNLSADADYRVVIKPTANSNIYTQKLTFESTAALAVIPEGTRWQYTSRADAGTWTNDNVSVCPLGLWVSDITFSTTSGGGGEYAYIG